MAKTTWPKESRNYRILAGAFLVATGFWFAVTMSGSFVWHYRIPLAVVGLPTGVALADQLPDTVEVALEGTGWQLLFLSIGNQLRFEVPGTRLLRHRELSTMSLMAEAIKLPAGVRVLRAYPESLTVKLDKFMEKKVPLVLPPIDVSFRQGFGMTGAIQLDPDSVMVEGGEKVVREIKTWTIKPVTYKDLSLPVSKNVPVSDSLHGLVQVAPPRVQLSINVEELADVVFKNVAVKLEDVPPGKEVSLLNATVKVYVRGGVNTLSNLYDEDFTAVLDYKQIRADTTGSVTPQILLPFGVTLLKVEPPSIRYTVRLH